MCISVVKFSSLAKHIAVAEHSKHVHIFGFDTKQLRTSLNTGYSTDGSHRIFVSDEYDICVVACYHRYGVTAYDLKTGGIIWQRKDLKKSNHIQGFLQSPDLLFVGFLDSASRTVSLRTGEDIKVFRNTDKLFYSSDLVYELRVQKDCAAVACYNRISNKKLYTIEINPDIVIRDFPDIIRFVGVFENRLLISFAHSPISCYDIETGKKLWTSPQSLDGGFENFILNQKNQIIASSVSPYNKDSCGHLYWIDPNSGMFVKVIDVVRNYDFDFSFDGKYCLCFKYELVDLETEERINIDFLKKWD